MTVGGVAVRVNSEALSSGSLRLKRSTAEQFFGEATVQEATSSRDDDPLPLLLHPYPPERNTLPVPLRLRLVPTTAHPLRNPNAAPQIPQARPPPMHCELCGLGAWLRGQGAVPGVHWVQLWRGARGGLMLRLCDGKPTELPGEEAEAAAEKQQLTNQQLQQQQEPPRCDKQPVAGGAPCVPPAVLAAGLNAAAAPSPTAGTGSTAGPATGAAAAPAAALDTATCPPAGSTATAAHAGVSVGSTAQAAADATARWALPAIPAHTLDYRSPQGLALGAAAQQADGNAGDWGWPDARVPEPAAPTNVAVTIPTGTPVQQQVAGARDVPAGPLDGTRGGPFTLRYSRALNVPSGGLVGPREAAGAAIPFLAPLQRADAGSTSHLVPLSRAPQPPGSLPPLLAPFRELPVSLPPLLRPARQLPGSLPPLLPPAPQLPGSLPPLLSPAVLRDAQYHQSGRMWEALRQAAAREPGPGAGAAAGGRAGVTEAVGLLATAGAEGPVRSAVTAAAAAAAAQPPAVTAVGAPPEDVAITPLGVPPAWLGAVSGWDQGNAGGSGSSMAAAEEPAAQRPFAALHDVPPPLALADSAAASAAAVTAPAEPIVTHTVWIGSDHLGGLGPEAFELWPEAYGQPPGHSLVVTMRLFANGNHDYGGGAASEDCALPLLDATATLVRGAGDRWTLGGVGQAGDIVSLARGPDGRVWAWLQQGQQQQQRQQPQPPQQHGRPSTQLGGRAAAAGPPAATTNPSYGMMVGRVNSSQVVLRAGVVAALWPAALELEHWDELEVVVYAAVGRDAPCQQQQHEVLTPHCVRVRCLRLASNPNRYKVYRLVGSGALLRELAASQGDAVYMRRVPGSDRIVAWSEPGDSVQDLRGRPRGPHTRQLKKRQRGRRMQEDDDDDTTTEEEEEEEEQEQGEEEQEERSGRGLRSGFPGLREQARGARTLGCRRARHGGGWGPTVVQDIIGGEVGGAGREGEVGWGDGAEGHGGYREEEGTERETGEQPSVRVLGGKLEEAGQVGQQVAGVLEDLGG